MKEEREEKWREENEDAEREGGDKVAMRQYYKVGAACLAGCKIYVTDYLCYCV